MSDQPHNPNIPQSPEYSFAQPSSSEVPSPLELSEEEDKRLLDLLNRAKEAKAKGDLKTSIELLQSYKEEYSRLRKERTKTEQGELSKEELLENQTTYDFLDIKIDGNPVNLSKEHQEGNIILLFKEQRESAIKEGYTMTLIVPKLERNELISLVKDAFKKEAEKEGETSEGIDFWDQAKKDLSGTQSALNNPRPPKFYQIMIKPQKETLEAHPETKDQTFTQNLEKKKKGCLKILEELNQDSPNLNLKGFTLPEYLYFQAHYSAKTNEHPDSKTWTWLLEELILDEKGNPARSLVSDWGSDRRGVGVYSGGTSGCDSDRGARFAAVAKSIE